MSMSRRSESAMPRTSTDQSAEAVSAVTDVINPLLADAFALYLKTKNFHWHVSGPHFRDYHLLLDEQGDQIFAMTDELAERARKSTEPHSDRSDTSGDFSASEIMIRSSSRQPRCCASLWKTIKHLPSVCGRHMRWLQRMLQRMLQRIMTWRRPAYSIILSTRRKSGPGSCSGRRRLRTGPSDEFTPEKCRHSSKPGLAWAKPG